MKVDGVPQPLETQTIHGQQSRLPYVAGLDGLRALALIAVLLYHADIAWIPGGFLGVEVFFVLSGYLITALLCAEWQAHHQIDLGTFWLRRARRLFPALLMLVGATLTFAVLFLPGEVAGLRTEAGAAVGYISNWYLILVRQSYFETMGRPSLLRHLWSLAVEGQFYLLWPPLFLLGLHRLTRHRMPWYLLLVAAASALWMALLYDPNADPSRVYFGTDTRAAGFCIGAALALFWSPDRIKTRVGRAGWRWLDLAGIVALAGLIAAFLWLDEFQPFLYRGGLFMVAIATATIIAALVHPAARLCPRLLGTRPLRWLGTRSYSLYLWHWPVFMVTRPQLDLPLDGLPLLAWRLLLSFTLAECSYRLVEVPIRSGRLRQSWKEFRQARGSLRLWLGAQWSGFIVIFVLSCIVLGESVATATPPEPIAYGVPTATTRVLPVTATPTTTPAPRAVALPTQTWAWVASPTVPAPPTITPTSESPATPSTASQDLFALFPEETEWLNSRALPPVQPTPTPTRITIVGDSVMLGALAELREAIPEADIDAAVGRQALEALQVLRARHEAGQLGNIVIVHLGSNGLFRAEQFDEIMQVLARTDRVMFVNVRVPRRWQDPVNTMLAEGIIRYTNVQVIDWYTASTDRPKFFGEDGVHLTREGAQVYAALIAAAISSENEVNIPRAAMP